MVVEPYRVGGVPLSNLERSNGSHSELAELRARVRALEEKIQGLRASRRVLMNLITAQEREKRARIARLESENRRLQKSNARFARAAMDSNIRICRLQDELRHSEIASGLAESKSS